MKNEYLAKQDLLQNEAKVILKELNLEELLAKYGDTKLVGSVALGLMSWKDIDVFVKTKPDYDDFLELTNELFKKQQVYSIQMQDFRKSIYSDRPQGLYCGIKYLKGEAEDSLWKIDIWFMEESDAENTFKLVERKLTDESRNIIIQIKNEMREKKIWGKKISGSDVYVAVLEHEIKSLEEFENYLRQQEKSVLIEKEHRI